MPIAVTCPTCQARTTAPDVAAGRKAKCPKCGSGVAVPPSATGPAKGPPPLPPRTIPATTPPKLIPCTACGQSIAPSAGACPHCGAANDWTHPEVRRFLAAKDEFAAMPPFKYTHDRLSVRGSAEVVRGGHAVGDYGVKALAVGALCLLFGAFLPGGLGVLALVVGPVGLLGGLGLILAGTATRTKDTDCLVRFTIDFRTDPPTWRSDDDEFWKDVKNFFFERG